MTDAPSTPAARNDSPYERFEALLDGVLGDRVRHSELDAVELWSALASTVWHGLQSEQVSYSMRSAGDVVTQVRGEGEYTDWYMSGPRGHVADWIAEAFGQHGWTWRPA